MGLGVSLILIAAGAILAWAVRRVHDRLQPEHDRLHPARLSASSAPCSPSSSGRAGPALATSLDGGTRQATHRYRGIKPRKDRARPAERSGE